MNIGHVYSLVSCVGDAEWSSQGNSPTIGMQSGPRKGIPRRALPHALYLHLQHHQLVPSVVLQEEVELGNGEAYHSGEGQRRLQWRSLIIGGDPRGGRFASAHASGCDWSSTEIFVNGKRPKCPHLHSVLGCSS
jgi:hypothetical protein